MGSFGLSKNIPWKLIDIDNKIERFFVKKSYVKGSFNKKYSEATCFYNKNVFYCHNVGLDLDR